MSMPQRRSAVAEVHYPDSDGRPMGETPRHVKVMLDVFVTLGEHFAADPNVFLAANMFLYYVERNARKHVSPDVFFVRGVPKVKDPERRSYRLWEEGGKGPDVVFEIPSESTRDEDEDEKMEIYRDALKVKELFLFDPYAEWLDPPLQGYRLRRGKYGHIRQIQGRLPSKVLGLHVERDEGNLRLYDPRTQQWVLSPSEKAEAEKAKADLATAEAQQATAQAQQATAQAQQAAAHAAQEAAARQQAEAELARLRRELDELRRRLSQKD